MELSGPKLKQTVIFLLKKNSYISRGKQQSLKNKNFLCFSKKFSQHFKMTADQAVK